MKKTLGVVAAAAMAAMPVMGVFATEVTSHTDDITLNINSVCTLGTVTGGAADSNSDVTSHAAGEAGAWGTEATKDTLTATMQPGTVKTLGSSTFTVRCNNAKGFALKASGTGTESHTTSLYKPAGTGYAAAEIVTGTNYGSGKTADDGVSYWGFAFSNPSEGMTITENFDSLHEIPSSADTVVASTGAAGDLVTGQSVTVTYTAGLTNDQDSGAYTGAVTYTLAQL